MNPRNPDHHDSRPGPSHNPWLGRGPRSVALVAPLVVLAIVLANDAFVISQKGFLHPPENLFRAFGPLTGDHFRYIEMARENDALDEHTLERADPDWARRAPWRYRILTPTLARTLIRAGVDPDAAFYLISQIGLVVFLLALYWSLIARGFDWTLALLGIALVGLTPGAVRWYAFQYWMTDPLALASIAIGMLAIHTQRWGLLVLVSLAAAANRETIVVLFPYLFLYELRAADSGGPGRAAIRTAVLGFAPLCVWLAVHSNVDAAPAPSAWETVASVSSWRALNPGHQLYFATIGSFGALLPLLMLPKRHGRDERSFVPDVAFVALIYASLAFATNTDRLLAYALPALLPLALESLRNFQRTTRLPMLAVAVPVLCVQLVFYLRRQLDVTTLEPFDAVTAGAVAAFIAGCWLVRNVRS